MANPTITINATGITVSGPLIAGEPVAVTASGLSLPEGAALTLALSSRAPNALLASCVLAESEETPGTWTGTLETASRQMAVYFATAAADDTRPAVLELIETTARDSLALLVTSLRNSALIPSSSPCAVAPVYIPVPGPHGEVPDDVVRFVADSAGNKTAVTVGSRASGAVGKNSLTVGDTMRATADGSAAIGLSSTASGAGAVALGGFSTASGANSVAMASGQARHTMSVAIGPARTNGDRSFVWDGMQQGIYEGGGAGTFSVNPAPASGSTEPASGFRIGAKTLPEVIAQYAVVSPYDQSPEMDGEASAGYSDKFARGDHRHPTDTTRQAVVEDLETIRSGAAAGATSVQPSALSAYRTASAQDAIDSGKASAADVTAIQNVIPSTATPSNKLVTAADIPAAQVNSDWNAESGVAAILNKPTIPAPVDISGKADSAALAPAFSTSSTYAVGDYVTYEGLLYKCTTAVSTAGAWDAADWTAVAVTDEMGGGGEANVIDAVQVNGTALTPDANKAVNIKTKIWSGGITTGGTGLRYDIPVYGDGFAFEDGVVVVARIGAGPIGASNMTFNVGGTGYKAVHGTLDQNASYYNIPSNSLHTGDTLILKAYKHATNTNLQYWILAGVGRFSPALDGTPTAPTAAAGTNTTQIATTAFVQTEARYALTAKTPSVSGTTATVACEDRAINDFTVATGITSLTIAPPAAVTGRARDFFCRVSLTDSSLPTVTLSGGTIDIGQSEVAGMTQGVNILMFTEISSGHWLASRRSAS